MIEDRTVDLVFSFDSLVHLEANVMDASLEEIARVLSPDGVAFLHHSNLGPPSGEDVSFSAATETLKRAR